MTVPGSPFPQVVHLEFSLHRILYLSGAQSRVCSKDPRVPACSPRPIQVDRWAGTAARMTTLSGPCDSRRVLLCVMPGLGAWGPDTEDLSPVGIGSRWQKLPGLVYQPSPTPDGLHAILPRVLSLGPATETPSWPPPGWGRAAQSHPREHRSTDMALHSLLGDKVCALGDPGAPSEFWVWFLKAACGNAPGGTDWYEAKVVDGRVGPWHQEAGAAHCHARAEGRTASCSSRGSVQEHNVASEAELGTRTGSAQQGAWARPS